MKQCRQFEVAHELDCGTPCRSYWVLGLSRLVSQKVVPLQHALAGLHVSATLSLCMFLDVLV